jgi:hypothetical protein
MDRYELFLTEISAQDRRELNALKHQRQTATQICKKLQDLFPSRALDKLFILRAVMYVTELGLSNVSSVMGWSGLGGELSDEKLDKLVEIPK